MKRIAALEREILEELENEMSGFDIGDTTDRHSSAPSVPKEQDQNVVPKAAKPERGFAKNPKTDQGVTPVEPDQDQAIVPKAAGENVVNDVLQRIQDSNIFPPDHNFMKRCAYTESLFGEHKLTSEHLPNVPYYGGIWQVDKIGFDDTKKDHATLLRKHAAIKDKFGIDWMEVRYEELTKPLYSALAARLLLSNKTAPIPEKLEEQANYYKTHHNSNHENAAGSADKFIKDAKHMEAISMKKKTK